MNCTMWCYEMEIAETFTVSNVVKRQGRQAAQVTEMEAATAAQKVKVKGENLRRTIYSFIPIMLNFEAQANKT